MKTKRLVTVVAVVAIVLSVSVLGTSIATANTNVVKNVNQGKVADPSVPPRPPFPHRNPGESGRAWVADVLNWVHLLLDWLHSLHFHFHFR